MSTSSTQRDPNSSHLSKLTAAEKLAFCEESIKFWHSQANMWLDILRKQDPNEVIPAEYCHDRYRQAMQRAAEWELETIYWLRTK